MQPWWLDWTAGLFPVILVVFLLRSFLFEPFKIPSGSMMPTLLVGDLILVNKFHYGVRLPVINKKIIANHDPQRGDVMVFRYPEGPEHRLHQARGRRAGRRGRVPRTSSCTSTASRCSSRRRCPSSTTRKHVRYVNRVQGEARRRASTASSLILKPTPFCGTPGGNQFPFRENCRYSAEGVTCKVPPGHYFMMGDNRDNSQDSRYWGFVPDENIVGKAFFVWMNFGNLKRIGSFR